MKKTLGLIGLICVTLPVGCAENKMTRGNFDTIREGMSTREEVRLTLGDPYAEMGDQWEYEDKERHIHATVHFDDRGVVTRKEWMDGKTGEWSGAAPGIDEKPHERTNVERKSYGTIRKN